MKKKIIASVLTFMMVMSACPSIYAATEHYNDSSKTGDAESCRHIRIIGRLWLPILHRYRLLQVKT